jgi:hypothetical protein
MCPGTRCHVVQLLAGQKQWDAETRDALLSLFADPSAQVRQAALPALQKSRITPEEACRLEGLLERRSRGLRHDVAHLLAAQKDAAVLESCDRLLAATRRRRLVGLELLRRMAEDGRRVTECRARAADYQTLRPTLSDEERERLDAILHPDRKRPSVDDALGLMDPARLTPPVPPKKRKVQFITPAAVACLKALDDLTHEHRETVIKFETRTGYQEALLGSGGFPHYLPGG